MRRSFKIFVVAGIVAFFFILIGSTVQAQSFSIMDSCNTATVSPPGQITITVALDNGREMLTPTLIPSASPILPARLKLVGSAFAIQARNASATRPMTVQVHYTPFDQMDERQLVIAYYDPTADKWLPLPTTIDSANHVATATAEQADTYALVLSPAVAVPPSSAIIVDDLAAGFVRYGSPAGLHSVSGAADHYYLGHMYWTSNTFSVLDNYAVWTPALSAGSYQVYVFIDWDNATTQNARYQIVHNGQTTLYPVNQNSHYAEWIGLGTYDFGNAAGSNYVRLEDVTGETYSNKRVSFDAIAFVPNQVYLPLVLKNYQPLPPPASKYFSGMHMGNRNNEDWTNDMLAPFDPAKGGAWPKIAVALSHQLFTVNRDANCHITDVVINPNGQSLYNYLKKATQQGDTWVIVRIYPSPGNFQESIDPNWPDLNTRPRGRTLINQVGVHPDPANWTQCEGYEQERFRSVDDIGDEILAIQRTVHDQGWDVFGFEPANEPNAEWFANPVNPDLTPKPAYYEPGSWQAMDPYFANLYDYVHSKAGSLTIRVFTPPMAQGANAETGNTGAVQGGCQPFAFSGYEQMPLTFNSGSPKNDGYSWHNYFIQGKESWANCPDGQHVSMYFPEPMSTNIQNHYRSSLISEADLAPPQMQWENPVTDKDAQADMAAASIQKFLHDDYPVERVAVWLLNDNTGTAKHEWAQAYTPTLGPRSWFIKWWYGSENP